MENESMYVVVYSPATNEVYLERELGDEELMDARVFADQIADQFETSIAESNGYIPNCCGDIRVEFRPDPSNPTHIWSGESFYFAQAKESDVDETCDECGNVIPPTAPNIVNAHHSTACSLHPSNVIS